MNVKRITKELLIYILCGIILWYVIQSIIYSKEITADVSEALKRCINVVFPSLFGIMVVSDFLVRTKIHSKIGIIFYPVSRWIFRMPCRLFTVFFLSNIGGYPVGIRLLKQLKESGEIDGKTAENMAVFCYCSGPSFIVGIIGVSVYSSVQAGVIVYLSCLLSNVFFAVLFGIFGKYGFSAKKNKIQISSQKLVDSVSVSGKNMMTVCLMIISFSYLLSVFNCLSAFEIFKDREIEMFFKSFLEITYITGVPADFSYLPVISFIASTGGLCVLMQIISLNGGSISLKRFFISRIPAALLSALICYGILKVFPVEEITKSCYLTYNFNKTDSDLSILSVVCMFFMIIIIFFQKKTSISEKSVL